MTSYLQRGYIAIQSQRPAEAAEWFAKAVEESPKDGQAKACLGQSLCWLGRRVEGVLMLRKAGQDLLRKARKRKDVGEVVQLAQQLQYWEDYAGSLALAKQALPVNNADPRCHHLLALGYARLNQANNALAAGRQALKLDPDNATANILQASLEATTGQYEAAQRRLEKILGHTLTAEEKFRAHKEMARILDKTGGFDRVFPHLQSAADLSASIAEIKQQNIGLVPAMIKTYAAEFDRELLGRWSGSEFPHEFPPPIFLLGFLRSGTTLTQEVLDAHSEVFVADEPNFIVELQGELNRLSGMAGTVAQQLKHIDLPMVIHLRQYYWDKVRERYGDRFKHRILVDKTTMNTINLGLINCIFPDAKVVFVMRDPRDVCLSCFMQIMSPTPSTVHLNDWQGTARFYALIMDWWMEIKQRTTLDFIEFRYEDAVTQFEPVFQKIFDFLGLSWEPSVVDFHRKAAKKYISSPSFNQVAQPLYASSVGRWKHYESEFAAIAEILRPYVTAFNYE